MMHAFDELITLIKLTPTAGSGRPQETDRREVYADVYYASQTAQYNALAASARIDLQAKIYADDYDNHTHVITYDGERYKISSVSPADTPRILKLSLTRG